MKETINTFNNNSVKIKNDVYSSNSADIDLYNRLLESTFHIIYKTISMKNENDIQIFRLLGDNNLIYKHKIVYVNPINKLPTETIVCITDNININNVDDKYIINYGIMNLKIYKQETDEIEEYNKIIDDNIMTLQEFIQQIDKNIDIINFSIEGIKIFNSIFNNE